MRPESVPRRASRRPRLPAAEPPSAEQVLRDHAVASVRRLTGGAIAGSVGLTGLVTATAAASYTAAHSASTTPAPAAAAAQVVDITALPDAAALLPSPTPAPLQVAPVAPARTAPRVAAPVRVPSQAATAHPVAAPPRAAAPPPPPPPPPQSAPSPVR